MTHENQNQEPTLELTDSSESTQKIIPLTTKIKIVAALFVVGVSTYAAYWVQEPTQLRTDVVTDQSMESASTPSASTNPSPETSASSAISSQTSDSTSLGTTKEVSISNFSFDPMEVIVEKGTTVVWVNKDSVPHSVVGDNFTSGTLDPGQSFSFTFTEEGTFDYYCSFHPQMKGTVTVAAASGATSSMSNTQDEAVADSQASATSTADTAESSSTQTEFLNDTELHNAPDQSAQITTTTSNTAQDTSENGDAELIARTPSGSSLDAPKSLETEKAKDEEKTADKMPDSGPEDFIYIAVLGAILYFNRKKILQTIAVK